MTSKFVPSDEQRAILDFIVAGQGHGLVVARAGCGKTESIVQALLLLPPGAHVLCCAFNARIRDTLLERAPRHVRVRSLHQLGRDTLRSFGDYRRFKHDETNKKLSNCAALALAASPWKQKIADAADDDKHAAQVEYEELHAAVMKGAALVKATNTRARAGLLALIEEYNLCPTFVEEPNEVAEYIAGTVRYGLSQWPLTDFDDEVWLPVHFGLGLQEYDRVIVDELQDLTATQIQLACSALRPGGRFIGIGDPAQAIYRWRGAARNTFDQLTVAMNATVLPLTVSRRCPRVVIRYAQEYVPDIQAHADAPEGRDGYVELSALAAYVKPHDFVLSRTNAPLARIGLGLMRRRIAVQVLGSQDVGVALVRFVKRSRKKTTETFLTWLEETRIKTVAQAKANARLYLEDQVATLREFAVDTKATAELITKVEQFYQESKRTKNAVVLATVHKLKGEEAQRVFVLEETFFLPKGDAQEEKNLWYVAITRSKSELYFVEGLYPKKKNT